MARNTLDIHTAKGNTASLEAMTEVEGDMQSGVQREMHETHFALAASALLPP